ncbi:PTS mannose/fructose/sorbose transporter subunit IIC [Limosilactobacillus sp.]|uniref:PTS mannose/fructose/sorbose transporter subunit IIC n=1 Tax=Limosilactobacillus sp. TaxID=2773925 RepID=UPI00345EC6B2
MSNIMIVIVAFIVGCGSVMDSFETYQPLIACSLIGLFGGHPVAGLMLGGELQMIALGWANVGAAMSPDAGLAGVASAIILLKSGGATSNVGTAIGLAIPLAVAGLFLTMLVRTVTVFIVHIQDHAAEEGKILPIEIWQFVGLSLQGLRVAIPAALLLALPTSVVQSGLNMMPKWLSDGMTLSGGMVVAVGYAMIMNMMSTRDVWPFFAIGFVIAALSKLTLIAIGTLGLAFTLIYLQLLNNGGGNGGSGNGSNADSKAAGNSGTGDPLGDILDNY